MSTGLGEDAPPERPRSPGPGRARPPLSRKTLHSRLRTARADAWVALTDSVSSYPERGFGPQEGLPQAVPATSAWLQPCERRVVTAETWCPPTAWLFW